MAKESKWGDTFPVNRPAKWGSMDAGAGHLSDEWHDMEPSAGHMSEKWVDQAPSPARMSEKWVDMERGTPMGNQWHEMKPNRDHTSSTFNNERENRDPLVNIKRESADNRVGRPTQHTEFGSTREI